MENRFTRSREIGWPAQLEVENKKTKPHVKSHTEVAVESEIVNGSGFYPVIKRFYIEILSPNGAGIEKESAADITDSPPARPPENYSIDKRIPVLKIEEEHSRSRKL